MAKGKSNNRMPKKAEVVRQEISIDPGNTAILTVRLLNDINNNLVDIKKALKNE